MLATTDRPAARRPARKPVRAGIVTPAAAPPGPPGAPALRPPAESPRTGGELPPPQPEPEPGAHECPQNEVTEALEQASPGAEAGVEAPSGPGTNRVTGTTTGYIPEKVTVWKGQRAVIVDAIEEALPGHTDGQLRLFAHVAWRQYEDPKTYADGVPIYHELIEPFDEDTRCHSARAVHGPLREAGLLSCTRYKVPDGGTPGQSRLYSVPRRVVDGLADAAPAGVDDLPGRVDLFTGNRARPRPRRHELYVNGNPVGTKTYRRAVQSLEYDYYDAPRVEAYLRDSKETVRRLEEAWEAAGRHEFVPELRERLASAEADGDAWTAEHWGPVVDAFEADRGEPRTPEFLAYRNARLRYLNDRRCYDAVLHQRPEETGEPGVRRYRLAYRHQTSGRAGAIGGMFQSCSRGMKEAAHGSLPDVYNYDLVASQPNFLVEEFEAANAHPSRPAEPLDPSWLERYLADPDGKATHARRVGISVTSWKTALLAMMMGAWVAANVSASAGAVAEAFRADPACSSAERLEACWARFREVTGPFHGELGRWRRWLDEVYARDGSTSGPHRSGGRWVRNAAGETYHWKETTPAHTRRAQLAAHMLQGREAALILHLITLADEFGFEVLGHEHDGLVTRGAVPAEAVETAEGLAGVRRAVLRVKPYV